MEILNYRNAESQSVDNSLIDVEILTDKFGWIPTTVNVLDDEQEPHTIQIKQWLVDNFDLIAAHVPHVPTQEELQAPINQDALEYLKSTDWYVTRRSDTGVAIPVDIDTYRAAAREAIVQG